MGKYLHLMAENLGWEFMSYALILLCAVHWTGVIQRGREGGSKSVSDRRKITKTEGKMKLKKETHWRDDEMCKR